jgi:hypothetical protein
MAQLFREISMPGRSLWSVLTVAWLSATKAAVPPPGRVATAPPPAEPERDGDASALVTPDGVDRAAADDADATDDAGRSTAVP